MKAKIKIQTVKTLAVIAGVAGITLMFGWIFDINVLKSISPAWASMTFDTTVAFVLSGISLYFIARAREGEFDKAQAVLSLTSLGIVLLMGTLFFSILLNIETGVKDLFINDSTPSAMTVVPGRPSLPTTINFLLIALAGILTMWNPDNLRQKLKIIGLIVAGIGGLAATGYIFNIPLLYYFIPGVNSAMPCHTALLFVLLGTGLLCL